MGGYGPAIAGEMAQRADEIHADNKQKKDEEHARKISDLILERQELINKIPTLQQGTPEYMDAHTALQGVNGDIADVYHPQKNPGAIEKFGHLLTDHMKITNPKDRVVKQAGQQQARTDASAKTTDRQIAAAPLSAAQLNAQKIESQLKEIDASGMSDEDKKAAKQKVFGVVSKANWQQFKNADDTLSYYDVTNPDSIPPGATAVAKGAVTTAKETIAGYEQAVKGGYTGSYPQWVAEQRRLGAPSTSALNEYAASYQKAYGIKPEDMTPEDWDFIQRKMAYDKAIPQTTTANTLKQNFQEQWVPIQETNTKSPGGAAPAPPRGKPKNNTPPPSAAVQSAPPATPQGAASAAPTAQPSSAPSQPRTMVIPNPKGLVETGNIPIDNRPSINNADGSHSSEYSTSFEQNGTEILVPTIVDGKFLTPDGKKPKEGSAEEKAMFAAAEDHYNKTGQNLGKFKTSADADAYANQLHNRGEAGEKKSTTPTSPRALLGEAKKRAPKGSSDNPSPSTGANASVRVGQPIMAAPSKEYREAKTTYHAALTRQEQMHQYLADAEKPGPPNQQAMLGLLFNHIGMTQGAQKGARINQKSVDEAKASTPWIDSKIAEWFHQDKNGDYIFDGLKGGVNLTKPQMEQMVELADEGTNILKKNLDTVEAALNDGVTNPSKPKSTSTGGGNSGNKPPKPTKPAPKGATHRIKHGDKWYYTDDQGNNLGEIS